MPLDELPHGEGWPAPLATLLVPGATPAQVADAVEAQWRAVGAALQPIIGHRGVSALYHRSRALAAVRHPWLREQGTGALTEADPAALRAAIEQRSSAEAAAGCGAHLTAFRDLLSGLIGASLTDRLLDAVWHHPLDDLPAQDPPR